MYCIVIIKISYLCIGIKYAINSIIKMKTMMTYILVVIFSLALLSTTRLSKSGSLYSDSDRPVEIELFSSGLKSERPEQTEPGTVPAETLT